MTKTKQPKTDPNIAKGKKKYPSTSQNSSPGKQKYRKTVALIGIAG